MLFLLPETSFSSTWAEGVSSASKTGTTVPTTLFPERQAMAAFLDGFEATFFAVKLVCRQPHVLLKFEIVVICISLLYYEIS